MAKSCEINSTRTSLASRLRDAVLRVRRRPKKCALEWMIWLKWLSDKRQLPLSKEHWDLYAVCHRLCHYELGGFPNLVTPRDFNDRIQWLKLFDQSVELTRCADKIRVRDYIRERVGEGYLTVLFQVCDHFDEIDFEGLPDSFVIKTNHDSGSAVLVPDKKSMDQCMARRRIETSLRHVYGGESGEWHYQSVRPKVLVEEFIRAGEAKQPSDYRFHCVNGVIKWVQVDTASVPWQTEQASESRTAAPSTKMKEVTVDPQGRPLGIHFSTHKVYCDSFTRPAQWEEMCSLAEKLASGWKYVRIDMFVSGDRMYAGEMTFFPYRGVYRGEGQKQLGQLLDFDRSTYQPPVFTNVSQGL